jgi:hypothetical protein
MRQTRTRPLLLPPTPRDPNTRLDNIEASEIFGKSHAQVFEDMKLLDDKLGRLVLSLAFLTSAAVVLFSNLVAKDKVALPNSHASVTAFTFLVFIAAAGLSLVIALAGTLMVGLPRLESGLRRRRGTNPPSLLSFGEIAEREDAWKALEWSTWRDLSSRLARDLHSDTLDLAKRTHYKAFRARESLACLHLAIVSLVVLAVFLTKAYSIETRWWIVSAFLALASLLPFMDCST